MKNITYYKGSAYITRQSGDSDMNTIEKLFESSERLSRDVEKSIARSSPQLQIPFGSMLINIKHRKQTRPEQDLPRTSGTNYYHSQKNKYRLSELPTIIRQCGFYNSEWKPIRLLEGFEIRPENNLVHRLWSEDSVNYGLLWRIW
ncbi:hypothetical protein L484_012109 [Morus notabilis]|uniref:Uncharacterized protein n=1 Tax=Morus notabilis TaxID=981085 RepID=W9RD19_9ROSA|nr:hypothetical protein L484_012109 [Morus notabilis]